MAVSFIQGTSSPNIKVIWELVIVNRVLDELGMKAKEGNWLGFPKKFIQVLMGKIPWRRK